VYRAHVRAKPNRSSTSAMASKTTEAREEQTAMPRIESRLDSDAPGQAAADRAPRGTLLPDEQAGPGVPDDELKMKNETRTEGSLVIEEEEALDLKNFAPQGRKPTIRFRRTPGAIEAEVNLLCPIMTNQQFCARLALLDESGRVLGHADAPFSGAVSAGTATTLAGYRVEPDGTLATFRGEPKTLRFTVESEDALARASRFTLRVGVLWEPWADAFTYDPTNGVVGGGFRVRQ
jgi:hypothetical protein